MLEITYRKISELTPYENNARTHSASQVGKIKASIEEFGFTNPVLVDENLGVIAGHGRLMAAQELGMGEVPTITLTGLKEAQRRAYIIADNKLALDAGWDEDMLKFELDALDDLGFNLELTGFSVEEMANLFDDGQRGEAPESSSKEINPDDYKMDHACPKCGFEFND